MKIGFARVSRALHKSARRYKRYLRITANARKKRNPPSLFGFRYYRDLKMRKQHGNDPRDYDRCTTLSISFLSLSDTLHFSRAHVLIVNSP